MLSDHCTILLSARIRYLGHNRRFVFLQDLLIIPLPNGLDGVHDGLVFNVSVEQIPERKDGMLPEICERTLFSIDASVSGNVAPLEVETHRGCSRRLRRDS